MRRNNETSETTDLCLRNAGDIFFLDNMTGKDTYCKLIMLRTGSGVTVPKIAKYVENTESVDWRKIYSWANKVPADTKAKEFQYKFVNDLLLNRYLLSKWKIVDSAACIYCKAQNENYTYVLDMPSYKTVLEGFH